MNPDPLTSPPEKRRHKILVVDDSIVIIKTLTFKLKAAGFEVLTAMEGADAVAAARKEMPDLILLDISFPNDVGGVGWDGFRLMDWLRRNDEIKKIPIFVISGGDPAQYEKKALAAGAVAFFHKPLNHDDLIAMIRRTLGEGAPPAVPVTPAS